MNKLNAKFDGMYKKFDPATGKQKTIFRYTLTGTPEAIAAYAKSQGDNLRKKDVAAKGDQAGDPLFFSTRFIGKATTLEQAQSGNWFANQESLEMANSLAEQFPALAGEIGRQAMGSIFGSSNRVATPEAEPKEQEQNINNA